MVHLRFIDNEVYLGDEEIPLGTEIYLPNRGITEISGTCPDGLATLNLRGNRITSLFGVGRERFHVGNLKILTVEDNQITSLFDESGEQFQVGNLHLMRLGDNLISSLFNDDGRRFDPGDIKILCMENNRISSLFSNDGLQFHPGNLYMLNLYGNQIASLFNNRGIQFQTRSLVQLVLENNQISRLINEDGEIFDLKMSNLEYINLAGNPIAEMVSYHAELISLDRIQTYLEALKLEKWCSRTKSARGKYTLDPNSC